MSECPILPSDAASFPNSNPASLPWGDSVHWSCLPPLHHLSLPPARMPSPAACPPGPSHQGVSFCQLFLCCLPLLQTLLMPTSSLLGPTHLGPKHMHRLAR